ncbi:hypothetical protein ACO0LF_29160 [Undibacterium sp. Di27W]|uniref:hypothetical protein n=1 Tax=Undibacterium sp. Di27W TaxID=3413036 RepID=UPI003BF0659E
MKLRFASLLAALILGLAGMNLPCSAMTMLRSNDTLILFGKVEPDDFQRFYHLLSAAPVKYVILTESPGGDMNAAVTISHLITQKRINTAVRGNCFSACAFIFMSGIERQMLAGKDLTRTSLGFHGPHNKDTLEIATESIPRLREWLLKATQGKFPEELLDQALFVKKAYDMMFFYYPGANPGKGDIRFCNQGSLVNPKKCYNIEGHDVVSVGILTTAELLKVEEAEAPVASSPPAK